jgi:Fe-S-cluster containining protein
LDYVEVAQDSPLLRRNDLAKRYMRLNHAGVPRMRLDPAHRCVALRGRLGESVKCAIYSMRPSGCRQVTLGSARCLQYRQERGLDG